MTRWRASGIHLLLSLLMGGAVFAVLFLVWYPPPLFAASGGDKLILLLLGIDVTIGPLLTLIVYRAGKRGMAFDLAFIAFCQVAALVYGLHVITASRPAFVAFAVDRFILVAANQLEDADLAQGKVPEFQVRSWRGPNWVAADVPTDANERSELIFSAIGGKDVERFPKYYVPYSQRAADAAKRARPLSALNGASEAQQQRLDAFRAKHADAAELGFLPLIGRGREMTAVLDRKTGEVRTVLDVAPW